MTTEIALEGRGLHGGAPARVVLTRRPGAVTVRQGAREVRVSELRVAGAVRATRVEAAGVRVGTVDHLFAALGGLGVREGVGITIEGDELPILDGCARAWCRALEALSPPGAAGARRLARARGASLRVARAGEVAVRASRYTFLPAREGETCVQVEVDFAGDRRLAGEARWDGDAADFAERIAPARTFAFARELEALLALGLAQHVAPESVVVIADDAILAAGAPFTADEPARHKLLDLVGDLYLHGGPPQGTVRARRPGHGATHEAIAVALVDGILERRAPGEAS